MNTNLYVVSTLALLYLSGCSADPYDNIQEEYDKYHIGSGEVVEASTNNDLSEFSQTVKFEDNKFSISGIGNSSSDPIDWYAFNAPEYGKYICAINYSDGSEASFNMYHEGHYDVSGDVGNTYTYSDEGGYGIYDEYNLAVRADSYSGGWSTKPEIDFIIEEGSNVYIEVLMENSGGNSAPYTIECFTPTMLTSIHQNGNISENITLPNDDINVAHSIGMSSDNLTLTGNVNSLNDQYDYFKFTIAQAGNYDINLTNEAGADIDLELYGADKSDIGNFVNTTEIIDSWTFSALAGGTYYLEVEGYSTGGVDSNYTIIMNKN